MSENITIPFHVWYQIAFYDVDLYYLVIRTVPEIGKWSLKMSKNHIQKLFKNITTIMSFELTTLGPIKFNTCDSLNLKYNIGIHDGEKKIIYVKNLHSFDNNSAIKRIGSNDKTGIIVNLYSNITSWLYLNNQNANVTCEHGKVNKVITNNICESLYDKVYFFENKALTKINKILHK